MRVWPVRLPVRTWLARSSVPWTILGLGLVAAAWAKLLFTPGELLQRDLEYPLFATDIFGDFYPMLAADGRSALGHLSLTPVFAVVALVLNVFGGTSGGAIRWLIVGQSLVAFLSMFTLYRLMSARFRLSDVSKNIGALGAGMFYALNPWAIARVEHLGLLFGYSLLPLVLGLAVLAVSRRSIPLAILVGLVGALLAASPHYLVFATVLLGLTGVYSLARRRSRRQLVLLARLATAGGLAFIGLQMFLILPTLASAWLSGGLPAELAATAEDVAISRGAVSPVALMTLTNNPIWSGNMRPGGQVVWIWSPVGLLPLGALIWSAVRRGSASSIVYLFLALALFILALETMLEIEAGSGLTGFLIAHLPGGRALRESDKLTGLLALAYAWGVGEALSWTTRLGSVRARLPAFAMTIAFAVALAAIGAPAIRYFLWTNGVANWLPVQWPSGYESPVTALRQSLPSTRLMVFERDERVPKWDATRVLRQPVSRALPGIPMVGWRHAGNSVYVVSALTATPAELAAAVRGAGADRVLVVHDTREGRELNERISASADFRVEVLDEYASLYSIRNTAVGEGYAAVEWRAVNGTGGLSAFAGSSDVDEVVFVADANVAGCPPELLLLKRVTLPAAGDVFPPCELPERMWPLRPDAALQTGWEDAAGSAAGLSRWVQALNRNDVAVREYDHGMGFAWIEPGTIASRTALFPIDDVVSGSDLYLRALVGDRAAPLVVEMLDARGTVQAQTRIDEPGQTRFDWLALGSPSGINRLRITAGEGLGGVNVLGQGADGGRFVAPSALAARSPPIAIQVERVSRTTLRATVRGASGPFALVVNENYSPVWRATHGGAEVRPFPAGYARMGFLIQGDGDFEIQIEFVPQRWHDAGLWISLATLVVTIAYLFAPIAARLVGYRRRAKWPRGRK